MSTWPVNMHQSNDGVKTATEWDAGSGHFIMYVSLETSALLDVLLGSISDAAVTNPASDASVIAALKGLLSNFVTEDVAAASGSKGLLAMAVRKDATGADAADGDVVWLQVDPDGRLKVSGTQIEDNAHTSGDRGHFALAIRRDSPTSDAAAGDYHGLHVDNLGRLRVITQEDETDATNISTTALATSLVIKASAGRLFGLSGQNDSGSDQYIQLHDAASLPADASVPKVVFKVKAGEPFSIDYGNRGRAFSTGIVVCNSSTLATKTIGAANCWFDAQYR